MKLTRPQMILGAISAGAAAVVGFLLLNGIITPEVASAASIVIAGLAGTASAK